MDARAHKRAACAHLATSAWEVVAAIEKGAVPVTGPAAGDDRGRAATAWRELAEEMDRRGSVVHRAPEPTDDEPAHGIDIAHVPGNGNPDGQAAAPADQADAEARVASGADVRG